MIVRPLADADARARWERDRDGEDPFGSLVYAEALSEAGIELTLCVGDGRPAAMVATRSAGPFRQAFVPPFTPYTCVALDPEDGEAAAHSGASSLGILAGGLAEAFDDVVLLLPPRVTDMRPLQWAGWTVEPRYTYRVDPAVAADPATWSDNPRRTLQQRRTEFRIEEGTRFAGDVAALCAGAYERHRRPGPMSPDAMATLVARLADSERVRVFAALDDADRVRAGVALVGGSPVSYYWMAGSEPGPAMTVLLASVFEQLAAARVDVLDFVGANTSSIAEFKRRFGPDLVRYHLARKTPNRALRFLGAIRSAFRS